jgi:hypothetical protein
MNRTVNRGWLKKQIEKGNIEIQCKMILTDDYAFDAASKFQKEENWKLADIKVFNDQDFRYKSGLAYWNEDHTIISWTMLTNHYYKCRLITA